MIAAGSTIGTRSFCYAMRAWHPTSTASIAFIVGTPDSAQAQCTAASGRQGPHSTLDHRTKVDYGAIQKALREPAGAHTESSAPETRYYGATRLSNGKPLKATEFKFRGRSLTVSNANHKAPKHNAIHGVR